MDVRSYETGRDKKWNDNGDNESGGYHNESPGKAVEGYDMRREEHYERRRAMKLNYSTRKKELWKTFEKMDGQGEWCDQR